MNSILKTKVTEPSKGANEQININHITIIIETICIGNSMTCSGIWQ